MADVEEGGRRLRGVVRWFNDTKGYGFITPDDGGEDYFVHQSSIRSDGFRSLGEGEAVEFAVEVSDGRTKAVDVTGPDGSSFQGDGSGGRGDRYGGGDRYGRAGGGDRYGGGGGYWGGSGGGDRYGGGGGYGFSERAGRNGGGGGSGACFSCGEMGHIARECSQGGRRDGGGRFGSGGGGGGRYGGGGGGECFACGEPGHFARECPNNSRN